jgi:pentatricopeptide repeat protein
MFLANRLPWLSQISTRCIFHTVTWIVSGSQVQFCSNSSSTGDATPGSLGRLSEFFCPVQVHISGLIVQALERGRLSDSVELELDRLHVDLDPFVVNRVLRDLSDSVTAVRFYWWAESCPGFDHTQFTIAYIVSMLFLDDNFALLSEFLERARSQGLTLHRSLYRILISGYVRAGKLDSVIQTFDDMVTTGCREFGVDYNRFISVLVKNCCFDLVEKYYSMTLEKGFCLTPFTYSRWIAALCQSGRIELVEKLLDDMDRFGCFPDIWACNIYVDYLCRENRLHDALQMLEKMGKQETSPDVVTYTTIVYCLCDNRRFSEAVGLWDEMVGRGLKPDTVACGAFCIDIWVVQEWQG